MHLLEYSDPGNHSLGSCSDVYGSGAGGSSLVLLLDGCETKHPPAVVSCSAADSPPGAREGAASAGGQALTISWTVSIDGAGGRMNGWALDVPEGSGSWVKDGAVWLEVRAVPTGDNVSAFVPCPHFLILEYISFDPSTLIF